MALVKHGKLVDDNFVAPADGDALPATGGVIVSLKRFLEHRDALLARAAPLGVRLEAAESPDALGEDVHRLAVVVLNFPGPRDGRAFSWARILRTRMGFKGEIRASGHYLRDHLAFLTRVGVDAFELTQNISVDDFGSALHEISHVYQPSADGQKTIWNLRAAK